VEYLRRNDFTIEDFGGDPKTEIQAKNVSVILEIPDDFATAFERSEPASVAVYADRSLDKSEIASERVEEAIQTYSREIGAMRLMVRGINPTVASAVAVESKDFSTRTARAGRIFGALQMLMLMAAFFGGAGVAIDTTAGERERKSLEPLLVHPVSSWQIITGKWVTVAVFGAAATLLSVLSTAVALQLFSLESLGIDPQMTFDMQLSLFVMLLPLALFASAAQLLVSLFGKTFKEAQTYLGMLNLLPMLSVMLTMFRELKTEMWMYLVPIFGQQQLMTSVLRGEGMDGRGLVMSMLVTTVVALGVLTLLARLLRSERVVYGG
jgi:sodium transport system permease protein